MNSFQQVKIYFLQIINLIFNPIKFWKPETP